MTKPVKGHFDKAGVAYKRYVREFRLENAEEYSVKDESRQTSSQQAIKLMQLLFPKVKVSRVPSRDTASTEDRWLTVPSSIVIRVPTVLQPHRDAYLRAKECRVTWAA